MSQHIKNNSVWVGLRENWDKWEKDCKDTGMPSMHTWRYHHSTFPSTKADNQAYDAIQLPTGYTWNMYGTKDGHAVALGTMAKGWATSTMVP